MELSLEVVELLRHILFDKEGWNGTVLGKIVPVNEAHETLLRGRSTVTFII